MGNELGELLEELRGKMSLRDAADKSGLSHTYIRDLELGINRSTKAPIKPSVDALKRLSRAYDYSYEDLLRRAGYLKEPEEATETGQASGFTPEELSILESIKSNPNVSIFFKDFASAPVEKQKELIRFWNKFLNADKKD